MDELQLVEVRANHVDDVEAISFVGTYHKTSQNVLDSKLVRGHLYYLVDWVGYSPVDRTWEPVENLANAADKVAEFHHRYPSKPRPSQTRGARHSRGG